MKSRILLLAFLLFYANYTFANLIKGTVVANGEPMPGTVITRIDSNGGTVYAVTDIDGKYEIDSGQGELITIMAAFTGFVTEMEVAEGDVVDFDLQPITKTSVDFVNSVLENMNVTSFVLTSQLRSMGVPGISGFVIGLNDNTLKFVVTATQNLDNSGNISSMGDTIISGYLQQLKQEGNLDKFFDQMRSSGMKFGFGVYNKTTNEFQTYKSYGVDEMRKLL